MRTLDMTTEAAEQVLVRLAGHLPIGFAFGRVLLVMPAPDELDGAVVLTSTGGWWVYPDRAERLIEESRELTTYAGGREVGRKVGL